MSFVHPFIFGQRVARHRALAYAIGFVLPVAHVTVAFAQSTSGGAAPGGGGGSSSSGGASAGGASGGSAPAGGTTTYQYFPGGVAPTPAGQTLGGGNTQYSSSKPITGSNQQDTFDFQRGGAGGTVHGTENSSFVIGSGNGEVRGVPSNASSHLVRKGDTLWGICDSYFHNPYQWPRIWAYNPQIQNPHWIYPGDQVRLRGGLGEATAAMAPTEQATSGGFVDRRRQVPSDTVFLRNQGYIDDDTNNWGEITGSREDKMFLSDYDEVYLRVSSNHDLKIGQELTVYRPIRKVGKDGKLIEIQGTVKVDQWNPKEGIARARVTESLDVIERGARVGPVARKFEVVPPQRNDKDVEAKVLASVVPFNLYGQNQVVFLDQGEEAGLRPGNRMLVIRKGDAWHKSLTTRSSARRIALEDESPAAIESVPKPRDESKLPEEAIAELRIISVRKNTAMALVSQSRIEIEAGDKAYARKGY
ncbi:hypothetical protein AKJ09_05178 [Labilithrix luteola]|uniref:LysM domain-containing protein n=1 Tax=Labilithrix luteola TaxID=1391654 RepID=A0A0K1PZD2_9BACT|nr:LysM peptidoglycan-binding domain-containing protein [Labilithrix luteola]AKU98514.1 hypothetical protein AKJ09_05178 [Labilithrix luteola]